MRRSLLPVARGEDNGQRVRPTNRVQDQSQGFHWQLDRASNNNAFRLLDRVRPNEADEVSGS